MDKRFDSIIDRRRTDSIKWSKIKGQEDLLPFWVADMDFKSPEVIRRGLSRRLDEGVYGYFKIDEGIYQAAVDWMKRRNDYQIDRSWLVLSPGVLTSLNLALFSLFEAGDEIIVQSPVYPPFYQAVKNQGLKLLENPLIKGPEGYRMDLELLKEQAKSAKAIIICNPHNPVGRLWSYDELKSLSQLAIDEDLIIISDDIHSDLVMKDYKYLPIGKLSRDIEDRLISFMSPSKTFNLAGLNTSLAIIANRELKRKFIAGLNRFHIAASNIFGKEAMRLAYDQGEQWLDDLLIYIEYNIDYVISYIEENIGLIDCYKPQAGYLMWLDFSRIKKSEDEIYKALIEDGKLLLNRGSDYGPGGQKFFRLNVATNRETLEKGMEAMKRALDGLVD